MNELLDLLNKKEELDPELAAYMSEEIFGVCIRHPLVYSVMHNPAQNAFVNAMLKQKKESLARSAQDQRWESYIWLHERPWRLTALMAIQAKLADQMFWRLAGQVWTDSENIYEQRDEWRDILSEPRSGRRFFMEDNDRETLKCGPEKGGLPNVFTVYRGFSCEGGEDGFSWTLDKGRAAWFARRFCHSDNLPQVATGTVSKRDVIAYMSGRGEEEIVCLPEDVCGIVVTEVKHGGE